MPLILESEKIEDYIEFGKLKLLITSNIPMKIINEFGSIKDIDPLNPKDDDMAFVINLIRKILLLTNKEKKVNKLLKKIGLKETIKIITFISKFITESVKEFTAEKKKDF